ncbi:hypothetical protein RCL1_006007 [Eukaryota sp. TZLM3-RCL]
MNPNPHDFNPIHFQPHQSKFFLYEMRSIGHLLASTASSTSSGHSIVANESSFIVYSHNSDPKLFSYDQVYCSTVPFYTLFQQELLSLLNKTLSGSSCVLPICAPHDLRSDLLVGATFSSRNERLNNSLLGNILSTIFSSQNSVIVTWICAATNTDLLTGLKGKTTHTHLTSHRQALDLFQRVSDCRTNSVLDFYFNVSLPVPKHLSQLRYTGTLSIVLFGPSLSRDVLSFPSCLINMVSSLEARKPNIGFSKSPLTFPFKQALSCHNSLLVSIVSMNYYHESVAVLTFCNRLTNSLKAVATSNIAVKSPQFEKRREGVEKREGDEGKFIDTSHQENDNELLASAGQRIRSLLGNKCGLDVAECPLSPTAMYLTSARETGSKTPKSSRLVKFSTLQSNVPTSAQSTVNQPVVRTVVRVNKQSSDSHDLSSSLSSSLDSKSNSALVNHIKLAKSEVKELHTQKVLLESQCGRLRETVTTQASEIESYKNKLSVKCNMIRRLEREVEKLTAKSEQLMTVTNQESDLTELNVSLRRDLKRQANQIKSLTNERDQLKTQLDLMIAAHEEHSEALVIVDNLSKELEEEREARKMLEEQLTELRDMLKEEMSKKNTLLDQERLVREATHKRTQKLVLDLEKRIDELVHENQQLNSLLT